MNEDAKQGKIDALRRKPASVSWCEKRDASDPAWPMVAPPHTPLRQQRTHQLVAARLRIESTGHTAALQLHVCDLLPEYVESLLAGAARANSAHTVRLAAPA